MVANAKPASSPRPQAAPAAGRDARRGETAPLNVPITAAFIGLLLMREAAWSEETAAAAGEGGGDGGFDLPPAGADAAGVPTGLGLGEGAQPALGGGDRGERGEGGDVAHFQRLVHAGEARFVGTAGDVFQLGGEGTPVDITLEGLELQVGPMAFGDLGVPPAEAELASEEATAYDGAGYLADVEDVQLGTDGDDVLTGTDGNDYISGGDGDDTIDGEAGDDTLHGDDGDDTVDGGPGHDNVYGDGGDDDLDGGDGSDIVDGGTGDDTLQGGDGADWGFDNLYGGFGSDGYVVNHLSDVPDESWVADAGVDEFRVTAGFIDDFTGTKPYFTAADSFARLPDDVAAGDHVHVSEGIENVLLEGDWDADVYGGAGANVLVGNAGANTIKGFAGDDVLDGRGGENRLEGGRGADTYLVDTTVTGLDTIVDGDGGDALTANTLRFKGVDRADLAIAREGDAVTFHLDGVLRARIEGYDAQGPVFHVETDDARFDLLGVNHAPRQGAELVDEWAVEEGGVGQYGLPEDIFVDVDVGDAVTMDARLADGAALPSWLSFDAEAGRFVAVPGHDAAGDYDVVVTASDAGGRTAADGFVLRVADVNLAPESLWQNADVIFTEDAAAQPTYDLARYFRDADGADALTYSLATVDGEPVPDWLTLDAATGVLAGRPEAPLDAPLELVVTARDAAGSATTIDLTVGVEPAASAPPIARDDVAVTVEDGAVRGDVLANDTHPEGLGLEAVLVRGPAHGTLEFGGDGSFHYTPDADFAGQDTFWYRAADAHGATSADGAVTIVTTPANDAPTVDPEALDALNAEIAALDLTEGQAGIAPLSAAVFTDVDDAEASLVYTARQGGPDGPRLAAPGDDGGGWLRFDPQARAFHLSPAANDGGDHQIYLTARDPSGAGESVAVTFDVAGGNQPPMVGTPYADATVREGQTVALDAHAHFADPDAGDILGLEMTLASGEALPSWLDFDPVAETLSVIPGPGAAAHGDQEDGTVVVRVRAVDEGDLASEWTSWRLDIEPLPDLLDTPPETVTAYEDEALVGANLTGRFMTAEGAALTATAADGGALPDWLTFDPASGSFSGTPTGSDIGEFGVRITATDAAGHTDGESFKLVVEDTNDAPTLDSEAAAAFEAAVAAEQPTQGQAFAVTVPADLFTDSEGDAVRVRLDESTLPPSGSLDYDAVTGTIRGVFENADVGEVTLRFAAQEVGTGEGFTSPPWELTFDVADVNDAPEAAGTIADQRIELGEPLAAVDVASHFSDVDAGDGERLVHRFTTDGEAGLPDGVGWDGASLTGTPAAAGSYGIEVVAVDPAGATSTPLSFTLSVADPEPMAPPAPDLAVDEAGRLIDPTIREPENAYQEGFYFADRFYNLNGGEIPTEYQSVLSEFSRPVIRSENDVVLNPGNYEHYARAVLGNDAENILIGSGTADILVGDGGRDVLGGGAGADELYGGAGEDVLAGGTGADRLYGGAGDDRYEIGGLNDGAVDWIDDADGANIIDMDGVTADRMSFGMDGADLVVAVDGTDAVAVRNFEDNGAGFDVQADDGGVANAALLAAVEEMRAAYAEGGHVPLADVLDGYVSEGAAATQAVDPLAAFAEPDATADGTAEAADLGANAALAEPAGTFVTPDGTAGSTEAAAAGLASKPAGEEDPAYG